MTDMFIELPSVVTIGVTGSGNEAGTRVPVVTVDTEVFDDTLGLTADITLFKVDIENASFTIDKTFIETNRLF